MVQVKPVTVYLVFYNIMQVVGWSFALFQCFTALQQSGGYLNTYQQSGQTISKTILHAPVVSCLDSAVLTCATCQGDLNCCLPLKFCMQQQVSLVEMLQTLHAEARALMLFQHTRLCEGLSPDCSHAMVRPLKCPLCHLAPDPTGIASCYCSVQVPHGP